jgi:hypothetical protein
MELRRVIHSCAAYARQPRVFSLSSSPKSRLQQYDHIHAHFTDATALFFPRPLRAAPTFHSSFPLTLPITTRLDITRLQHTHKGPLGPPTEFTTLVACAAYRQRKAARECVLHQHLIGNVRGVFWENVADKGTYQQRGTFFSVLWSRI